MALGYVSFMLANTAIMLWVIDQSQHQSAIILLALAAFCWLVRYRIYGDGFRFGFAVILSGGSLVFTLRAASLALDGELAGVATVWCAVLLGMAAATQMRPAGRFVRGLAQPRKRP